MATITVSPIHFEDYSGVQFERLVFAYHVRAGWHDLIWHGQSGGDQGRDISGVEPFDDRPARKTIIQCANRDRLTLAKAQGDMIKAVEAIDGTPDAFRFVSRGSVSDAIRTQIKQAAASLGIRHVTIWSGVEFEENLRLRAEYLLRRFVQGVEFPDAEVEIRKFVDDFPDLSDSDMLQLIGAVFDRPAFRTPFGLESSFFYFEKAIEDTIRALNTGVWRTREGDEIRRIPSIHHIRDQRTQAVLKKVVLQVDRLRHIFVAGLNDGQIKRCPCGQAGCPVYMLTHRVSDDMDRTRREILRTFRSVSASFDVSIQ